MASFLAEPYSNYMAVSIASFNLRLHGSHSRVSKIWGPCRFGESPNTTRIIVYWS